MATVAAFQKSIESLIRTRQVTGIQSRDQFFKQRRQGAGGQPADGVVAVAVDLSHCSNRPAQFMGIEIGKQRVFSVQR